MPQTIRNPIEWTGEQIVNAGHAIASAHRTLDHMADTAHSPIPAVRKITIADVRESLAKGFDDFEAYRSDVLFVGIIYAAVGLVLARAAFGSDMLPLLFPLASGFAIVGNLRADIGSGGTCLSQCLRARCFLHTGGMGVDRRRRWRRLPVRLVRHGDQCRVIPAADRS